MKYVFLLCAGFLFLALANLPIGFYTFLRVIVTIGAILGAILEFRNKGVNFWVIIFSIIGIIFNPLIPVYLHDKTTWAIIDAISGVLFLVEFFRIKNVIHK